MHPCVFTPISTAARSAHMFININIDTMNISSAQIGSRNISMDVTNIETNTRVGLSMMTVPRSTHMLTPRSMMVSPRDQRGRGIEATLIISLSARFNAIKPTANRPAGFLHYLPATEFRYCNRL